MTTQIRAPYGHPGSAVSRNYVTCPICDAMPDRNKLDPSRHIMCPACKTLNITKLEQRNNAPQEYT